MTNVDETIKILSDFQAEIEQTDQENIIQVFDEQINKLSDYEHRLIDNLLRQLQRVGVRIIDLVKVGVLIDEILSVREHKTSRVVFRHIELSKLENSND